MAILTQQEKNALRRIVRLLDMRENRGAAVYEQVAQQAVTELREMLQPTEQFVLHVPDDYAFGLQVVWYETRADGKKHLYLKVLETQEEGVVEDTPQVEGGAA